MIALGFLAFIVVIIIVLAASPVYSKIGGFVLKLWNDAVDDDDNKQNKEKENEK